MGIIQRRLGLEDIAEGQRKGGYEFAQKERFCSGI
jgi:hypothetical protein